MDVYRTVLGNAFEDSHWHIGTENPDEDIKIALPQLTSGIEIMCGNSNELFEDDESLLKAAKICYSMYGDISYHNIIIIYSILTNQVLDISVFRYSKRVVNSSQTDAEILKATVDLITLLIVGNQMVVTQKHNF